MSLLTVSVDIMLLDPPQGDRFYLEDDDITTRTHYLAPGTLLYNKGYVDFATQLRATPRASQSVPNLASSGESGPPRTSAMDDLVHFWSSYSLPFDFDPSNADIPCILYFELRIAASEWQCCLDSLRYLTAFFERSQDVRGKRPEIDEYERLENSMASLQMLKKRFTTFLGSIDSIRGLFQSHIKHPLGENNSYLADIELDFRFLASRVLYSNSELKVHSTLLLLRSRSLTADVLP
jgi:hypothetical protein